jgi:hypothetical protein
MNAGTVVTKRPVLDKSQCSKERSSKLLESTVHMKMRMPSVRADTLQLRGVVGIPPCLAMKKPPMVVVTAPAHAS